VPDEFAKILNQRYSRLVEQLKESAEEIDCLPPMERQIARLAIDGRNVYQVAQRLHISDAAVRAALGRIADALAGKPAGGAEKGYESGGLGADTDPGVTGGYGDTAFGAIGNEPPIPEPEEPE